MQYIPIVKEDVPYAFSVNLSGQTYEMEIDYNGRGDFFTIKLIYQNEVLSNEKIVFGKPLFTGIVHKPAPTAAIVPLADDEVTQRAGYNELGDSVQLYVFDEGDIDE